MRRKVTRKAKSVRASALRTKTAEKMPAARSKKTASPTAAQPDAIDALVTAGARALGLTIDPAWQASVKFNLQLVFKHAALVEGFGLPDEAEPAPIFYA
jgi:Protein of unknown function (DUF4089)